MSNNDKLSEIVNHPVTRLMHYIILGLLTIVSFTSSRSLSEIDMQIENNRLKTIENAKDIKENREDLIRNESKVEHIEGDLIKLQTSIDKLDSKLDKILEYQDKRSR